MLFLIAFLNKINKPSAVHVFLNADFVPNISYDMKFCPYYFQRSRILGQSLPEIDFAMFHLFGSILSHSLNRGIFQLPMA